MSNPELEKLAREVANRLQENLKQISNESLPEQEDGSVVTTQTILSKGSVSLLPEEKTVLAQIQKQYLSENSEVSRDEGIVAFSQAFNDLISQILEETGLKNSDPSATQTTTVEFKIPDLNPAAPGLDNDDRDLKVAEQMKASSSITAYQVLELDSNKQTNLTLRTAEDVYAENKSFYQNNSIYGKTIRSGSDIVNFLNSSAESLDSEFKQTLTEQIDNHFLNQKSSVHVVRDGSRGMPGSKLADASIEYRSRSMGELAEFLSKHENGNAVLKNIFETQSVISEIEGSEKSLTSDRDRRAWLTKEGDLTPAEQAEKLAEIKSAIIDMSNYFGPTGTDMLVTGMLNNPELIDQPFISAWKQLNPSTQGENGRIARAYLKEEVVFDRITEDFENQDPNATLGSLVRHTIARDVPVEATVPDIDIASEVVVKTVETPVEEVIEEDKPEVGVYAKSYQLPFDENNTINIQGYGVSLNLPTESGSVDIDAGILKGGFSNAGRNVGVVNSFETVVPESFEAYQLGDSNVILADPNDPNSQSLGESDPTLIQTNDEGERVVQAGGVNADIDQNADFIAGDVNVRVNNDDKNFAIEAGASYGKDFRRGSLGFEKQTNSGIKLGARAGLHSIRTNTDVTINKDPINTVVTLFEGVPAGLDENGKPVFDPEVQTRIDEYENITLDPRSKILEEVPDKDQFVREAGILVKDAFVVPQEERVKPMGIISKLEYVEAQEEKFVAKGIVPLEQWVQPLENQSVVRAMDASLPKRIWVCPPGATSFRWVDVEGVSVTISQAVQANENNVDDRPNPYSDAELTNPNLWNWELIEPEQFITPEEAESYTLPDGTGPVSIPTDLWVMGTQVVEVGPRVPVSDLPPNTFFDEVNDNDDWREIEGAELLTAAQAEAAGIPANLIEWRTIDGQFFTQEQVEEYGIPESEQESVLIDTGEFILLSDAESNGIPYVEGSNVWQVEDGADTLTQEEADNIVMPDAEREWIVIDGELVTQEQASELGYPEDQWEIVVVTDPDATPIPIEEAGDLYDPDSLQWELRDPAEYITLAEAQAGAAQGLPNMPVEEFEWAIIPDGQLLTPEEADGLSIPEDIREVVWVPNGGFITVQEADEQGIPYEDSEIVTSEVPDLDSDGNQLYDITSTTEEYENIQTDEHHITNTFDTNVNDIRSKNWTNVVDFSLYGLFPVGQNTTLGADLGFVHTNRPGVTFTGQSIRTTNIVDEFNAFDIAPTDDEAILSGDDLEIDNIEGNDAIGVIEGQGPVITPTEVNNSFTQRVDDFKTTVDGTATKLSLGLNGTHVIPQKGLSFGLGAEGGLWNTKTTTTQYFGNEMRDKTVLDQTEGYLSGRFNLSKTFNETTKISLGYQTKNLLGSDAAATEGFNVRLSKTIGGGKKSREQKKLDEMKKRDAEFKNQQNQSSDEKRKEISDSKLDLPKGTEEKPLDTPETKVSIQPNN